MQQNIETIKKLYAAMEDAYSIGSNFSLAIQDIFSIIEEAQINNEKVPPVDVDFMDIVDNIVNRLEREMRFLEIMQYGN